MKALTHVPNKKGFEHQMFNHIVEHFPVHAGLLGRKGVIKVINAGIEKGFKYGFTTGYEFCLFIDMMFMLGSGCDTDIQLPFVSRMLNDTSDHGHLERIDIVYKASIFHIEKILGPVEVFPVKALNFMRDLNLEDLDKRIAQNYRQSVEEELERLWPEKCIDEHKNVVFQLVDLGTAKAASYGLTQPVHEAYFVMWMFLLGHEFDKDPVYPWFSKVLNDNELTNEDDKFSKLEFTFKEILNKAL
jgi:hypothetical protein